MIIIQQTSKPLGSGSNSVKILDSTGAAILSDGSGQLTVTDAALQALVNASNILLTSIDAKLAPVPLSDVNGDQVTTSSYAGLDAASCKYITAYSLSTAAKLIEYRLYGAGKAGKIEPGYSTRINVSNASQIEIRQTGGEADTLYYIITS